MKTYDFTLRSPPPRTREAQASAESRIENGWEAYAAWLQRLREELSERSPPLPPELMR